MKTKEFLRKHDACIKGAKWALSIGGDMADVWDALVEQKKYAWLLWTITRPGVFSESVLRKLSCRFVRETPLGDGRSVWDLLTDERSRKAVEVAEDYADGKATEEDMKAAYVAADAAAYEAACAADAADAADDARAAHAAYAAAYEAACAADAADEAAYVVADEAAYVAADAADDAAKAAQVKMIAELGNPFKERKGNEHKNHKF